MVRPLRFEDRPMYVLVEKAVEAARRAGLSEAPGMTTHPVATLFREEDRFLPWPDFARERWRAAPPGTVFIWDSKYGGRPADGHPVSPLYTALRARGRSVARLRDPLADVRAEVFVRR
jgi:hypothetical protein